MNTLFIISTLLAVQAVEKPDSTEYLYDNLDEVVVVAKKEVVKSDGATLTYDMAEDESTKSLSLIDALKKVPMISVDGQDKIKINGDSNFKIYVNGKEDPMLEANYDKIFRVMPANSVQKIEVITDPGAKYDSEGSGGILNIITETKQRKDGYSGNIDASLSNREYSLSLLGRMKYKNFSADANVTYAQNIFEPQTNDSKFTSIDDASIENYRQIQNQTQKFNFNFINASVNSSWEPNEKNLFTFGGSIMKLNAKVKEIYSTTSMFDKDNNLQWQYSQDITGRLKNFSTSANASYQHIFDNDGHRIVAAYLFNFGSNPMNLFSETNKEINYVLPFPFTVNNIGNYTREHTFQVDYANPFAGEKHKLETGGKIILRHNSAISSSEAGEDSSLIQPIFSSLVNMVQFQDIYALYASYNGNFGKVSTRAGLRYEHTKMGIHNKIDSNEDFSQHLNDIVPNASVTYLFSPASNLRLAYQMRITRPGIQQMNPYQMNIMGTLIQEGNPDLKSEHTNSLSLTFTKFARLMGGNISLDYRYTNNALAQYVYFTEGNEGSIVMHETTSNIGHSQELGLGGFYNINITSKMTLSLNGRVAYVNLKSESPAFRNSGWTGNYGANWTYMTPKDFSISAYGGQSFNNINLQGNNKGWYYYGMGVSRSFFNDTFTVALNASGFLQRYTKFHSSNHSGTKHTYYDNKSQSWRIGVNLSWNFGNLKSNTKKTDLIIENDDVSKSDKGKGIGI